MNKMKITEQFLDKTIRVWQPHYEQKLTCKDAREIIETAYSTVDLIAAWDMDSEKGGRNDQSKYGKPNVKTL